MAQKQVRAMYDFDAQPGSGEMSIKMDEILVVLRDVSFPHFYHLFFHFSLECRRRLGRR